MPSFGAGSTFVNEVMNTVIAEGIQYFRMSYQCTWPGNVIITPPYTPLQDTGLFVYEIIDPGDPTKDLFTRITDIPDFFEYANTRAGAILAGSNFWRSAVATLTYTNFATANAAKIAMHDRIDALCQDFSTYSLQFSTLPAGNQGQYPLGIAPNTAVDQLADTYYTAFEDYLLAYNGDPIATGWQALLDDYAKKDALATVLGPIATQLAVAKAAMDYACLNYHAFVGPSDGSNAAWYYALAGGATPSAIFVNRLAEEDTIRAAKVCNDAGTVSGYSTAANGAYTAALGVRTTANTTLQAKHDTLATLYTAVGVANAAVLAACPTFEYPRGYDITDPTEFPPVPIMP
jgi:hypothetical protein